MNVKKIMPVFLAALIVLPVRHVLAEYVDHYNTHRPHRTLGQQPPDGTAHVAPADNNVGVRRRDRLGGLLHEYSQVA